MEKLKFNPDNKKYYSKDFIKGFECGVERQFNSDMKESIGKWEWVQYESLPDFGNYHCSKCHHIESKIEWYNYCPNCGAKMEVE